MTIAELIEALQIYPMDAEVVQWNGTGVEYLFYSEKTHEVKLE